MGEFPADYIFYSSGEVVDPVEAFESQRRAIDHVKSSESEGRVDSGMKTPCI
jgi:hypothetical protein